MCKQYPSRKASTVYFGLALFLSLIGVLCFVLPAAAQVEPAAVAGDTIVTSALDRIPGQIDYPGTLRWAIAESPSGGKIRFSIPPGSVITLNYDVLEITKDVTIDGQDRNIRIEGNQTWRIFKVRRDVRFTIIGLTLTGGKAIVGVQFGGGGALFNEGITAVARCRFLRNAAIYGGAIHNTNILTLTDSELAENTTIPIGGVGRGDGGAIYNSGNLTLLRTTVGGGNAAATGGGIFNYGDTGFVTLDNSTVRNNEAIGNGGGIYNWLSGATEVITGFVTITGNSRIDQNAAQYGGGIYNAARLTVSASTLAGNRATADGGALYHSSGLTATLSGTTFSANNAAAGGAIVNKGPMEITNSTLSHNTTARGDGTFRGDGGAIYNQNTLLLTGVTVGPANAAHGGGGIINWGSGAQLTLKTSSVTTNTATLGAGIENGAGGSVQISDRSRLAANQAANNGGGVYNAAAGSVMLTLNSSLAANSAVLRGGGAFNEGSFALDQAQVRDNSAQEGGGVYVTANAILTATQSELAGNRAAAGGAIVNQGTANLTRGVLAGNKAEGGDGGAIYNTGRLALDALTLRDNSARGGGALQNWDRGQAVIRNSTLHNNAAETGGAILLGQTSTLALRNSTLSSNDAAGGGAILLLDNALAGINSTTIYLNEAGDNNSGAGIDNTRGVASRVYMTNTIVAGNTVGGVSQNCRFKIGSIVSGGHNLEDANTCNLNGNLQDKPNTDPKLEALADNGGPTRTHAVGVGTPPVGAGDNAYCTDPYDQRGKNPDGPGFDRIADGNKDGTEPVSCDIGAFELQGPPCTTKTATITIALQVEPRTSDDFRFYGPFGEFVLDDPLSDDVDGVANTITFTGVGPGTHNFSNALSFYWSMKGAVCKPASRCQVDLAQHTLAVTVAACDVVTATFQNQMKAPLFVNSYWDQNGNGKNDGEPALAGWWGELYDLTIGQGRGTVTASDFTNDVGKWNLANLIPSHKYQVCQKPQPGWQNTQPGSGYLDARGWPCFDVALAPQQGAKVEFGYAESGATLAVAPDTPAGIRIIDHVYADQQYGPLTMEELVDRDEATPTGPAPDDVEVNFHLYLPDVHGQ